MLRPANRHQETAEGSRIISERYAKAGFQMFQVSIYIRPCPSREAAAMQTDRVKNFLPKEGKIGIFTLTDKQFGMMELFYCFEKVATPLQPQQLELF